MNRKVALDLKGDFHRDIRGAKVRLKGDGNHDDLEAVGYIDCLAEHQTGKVGDMTAGLPPREYTNYPYLEWFGDGNGRGVLELEPEQIEVIGTPIPACESDPISRQDQPQNMGEFLVGLAGKLGAASEQAAPVTEADSTPAKPNGKAASGPKGMKLLTKAIHKQLPTLYSQDGKGGDAVVYLRLFTPDSDWTWHTTEFDGQDTFFGLVEGQFKELGYFSLSELESVRARWACRSSATCTSSPAS